MSVGLAEELLATEPGGGPAEARGGGGAPPIMGPPPMGAIGGGRPNSFSKSSSELARDHRAPSAPSNSSPPHKKSSKLDFWGALKEALSKSKCLAAAFAGAAAFFFLPFETKPPPPPPRPPILRGTGAALHRNMAPEGGAAAKPNRQSCCMRLDLMSQVCRAPCTGLELSSSTAMKAVCLEMTEDSTLTLTMSSLDRPASCQSAIRALAASRCTGKILLVLAAPAGRELNWTTCLTC